MRVTNSMLVSNFMNNLNNNMGKLDKLQGQMATNKKYAHISDDPVSVIYAQQARQKLDRLAHYQHTVDTAQNWLTQTETALLELNDVIKSAYESCIDAGGVKSPSDKEKMAQYMGQLRDQVLATLNSAFGSKYVLGGYNTTGVTDASTQLQQAPFTLGPGGELLYNGCDLTDLTPPNDALIDELKQDVLTFDVGPGIEIGVTLNGIDVALYNADGDNIYAVLDGLYQCLLNGGSQEEISKFITPLQDIQNHLLAKTAEIGGRTNRLDILTSRYEQDELNYTQMKSDAQDADEAEVIMRYKMAESVYQAALASGSYIIQQTLMDFLR